MVTGLKSEKHHLTIRKSCQAIVLGLWWRMPVQMAETRNLVDAAPSCKGPLTIRFADLRHRCIGQRVVFEFTTWVLASRLWARLTEMSGRGTTIVRRRVLSDQQTIPVIAVDRMYAAISDPLIPLTISIFLR